MSSVPAITIRKPNKADGSAVWSLIREAGTLDLNSAYCYLLLCDQFRDTCALAEVEGRVVGFVSALIPPGQQDTLFIWQIAVAEQARGRGLGKAMLLELVKRCAGGAGVRQLSATISPSNEASNRLFRSLADTLQCELKLCPEAGYPEHLFPQDHTHEAEPLIVVGPFMK